MTSLLLLVSFSNGKLLPLVFLFSTLIYSSIIASSSPILCNIHGSIQVFWGVFAVDWFTEMILLPVGDIFSCHAVDNPDLQSEMVIYSVSTVEQSLLQHI